VPVLVLYTVCASQKNEIRRKNRKNEYFLISEFIV
jgi:hypothetical protein